MNECEILKGMVDLFGPNGEHWVKGRRRLVVDGTEKFCLVGAFEHVTAMGKGGDPYARAQDTLPTLVSKIAAVYRDPNWSGTPELCDFNDNPDTRWPLVKQVLDEAVTEACD